MAKTWMNVVAGETQVRMMLLPAMRPGRMRAPVVSSARKSYVTSTGTSPLPYTPASRAGHGERSELNRRQYGFGSPEPGYVTLMPPERPDEVSWPPRRSAMSIVASVWTASMITR